MDHVYPLQIYCCHYLYATRRRCFGHSRLRFGCTGSDANRSTSHGDQRANP